ncbi:hypothetical protein [Stackebrandtia nassauensis]|uniref:PH domain-containing protein n=1 Tax=Stackebrandtia nassauensis (strain DSM 44728 / CIP 108903 / NRRL B-16338 / NBRC 102104 / LLR-40K-21) TaxID=446470 RepID=D3PZS0_STANL|nr:hypothetical protein [Stackebrandtia nassauensis]ADD43607.1 hypothetical protein Snas_3955 [Stackebrandtia nassauensis DSM 44728]
MELRRSLNPMPFELRTKRDVEAKQMLLPALAALLVGISMALILDLSTWPSWALLGCVALVIVFSLFMYLRFGGRPVLAADTERLWIRIGAATFVGLSWSEVDNLRLTTRDVHKYLLWDAPTAVDELQASPKLWKTTNGTRVAFDTPFAIGFTNKDRDRRSTINELRKLAPSGTEFRTVTTT